MGGSSFSHDDWTRTSSTYSKKSASEIYRASGLDESIDPSKMKGGIREACDSDANPNSTPIIIGLDFTGSMRNIPEYMIKSGLGELFKEIYDRKPVTDPQVLFCGIGDVDAGDPAPFQVGQFESQCDRLITGLEKFWLRGCMGGGNDYESYDLPYYFAANLTKIDSMLKRGKKGFIFTIGDEPPPRTLSKEAIKSVFGFDVQGDVSFDQLIKQVSKSYIPFHIIMEEGSHPSHYGLNTVLDPWSALLGENAIVCSDYRKLSEVITSILQVKSGVSKEAVVSSWDGSTGLVVNKAISGLTVANNEEDNSLVF